MSKSVAEKMGVRPGARSYFHDAPKAVVASMRLPTLEVDDVLRGEFEHIHAFVTKQREMEHHLPLLRTALTVTGSLWLSWPKAGQLDTDLSLADVIRISYDSSLVESKCISIDAVWSALKLTHPREGKTYRNSYGRLPYAVPPEDGGAVVQPPRSMAEGELATRS